MVCQKSNFEHKQARERKQKNNKYKHANDYNNKKKRVDKKNQKIKRELQKSLIMACLLYTSPSPRDATLSRMPSSA